MTVIKILASIIVPSGLRTRAAVSFTVTLTD
jgi:hypothetical protein